MEPLILQILDILHIVRVAAVRCIIFTYLINVLRRIPDAPSAGIKCRGSFIVSLRWLVYIV